MRKQNLSSILTTSKTVQKMSIEKKLTSDSSACRKKNLTKKTINRFFLYFHKYWGR